MNKTDQSPSDALKNEAEWHILEVEDIYKTLSTGMTKGLSETEVTKRLTVFGLNQLDEAPPISFWQLLYEQFNNFVVILLIVAALISAILGDYIEAAAIMAIVVLNAGLGIIQEKRAEQALAALRKLSAPDAQVLRDGTRQTIPSTELVPGDIVFIEAGNYIPADVRFLDAHNFRVDEAALTGESVPVKKDAKVQLLANIPLGDRKNTGFMGTMATYGRATAVVIATGMSTQIGLIAEMLQAVEQEQTPLQRKLDQLGKLLGWAALGVCLVVFGAGWWQGTDPLEMFIIAVSLAIAAVPEGLPAVVTISLALGMREMIKHNALIRKLSSVESLGSATVICSDKTGTLTQNQMTVTKIAVDGEFLEVSGTGYTPEGSFFHEGKLVNLQDYPGIHTALWVGALNNDAIIEQSGTVDGKPTYRMIGDPTEGALIVAATKAGAPHGKLNLAYPRVQEIPFDSTRKRMLTIHSIKSPEQSHLSPFLDEQNKEWYVVTEKGAPDVVLDKCTHYQNRDDRAVSLDDEQRRRILVATDNMTSEALRVLGVAYKVSRNIPQTVDDELDGEALEEGLIFVGLIGMIDPSRQEVPPAIQIAANAGIRTIMITGDYPNTAKAIAMDIGLVSMEDEVITGPELEKMSDEELQNRIETASVFARVSPEHKVRIVNALRANGEIVAMTGDGVNDAPSIKQADIGVAMGITGTDVAKETADIVLTDDNYASIVSAVAQGRVIYSNIRKFVYYLLSCNLAEIAIIFIATISGLKSPLNAIQLLWLNLITDGAPALALGVEKGDPDIMEHPPRPTKEPIINKVMQIGISVQTVAITAVTLTAYIIGKNIFGADSLDAKTMAFVTLSFSELLRAYTARSETISVLKIGIFKNRAMNWAVISSLLLLIAVVYVPFLQPIFKTVPLTIEHWQYVLPLLLVPSIAAELTKLIVSKQKSVSPTLA